MQIRCYSCSMPISIGRASVNYALNVIKEDDLVYFDFSCPKCKKSNRVSKEKLLHASPAWTYESSGRELDQKAETNKSAPAAKKQDDIKADQKKAPAKKSSTEKTPAKKTPAKKTPAKKTPAAKAPAKKAPAKKTPAAKSPAKKTPAKKTPAKKTPAKKDKK